MKVEFIVQGGQVLDHAGGVVAHSADLLATQVAGCQGWESFPEVFPDKATFIFFYIHWEAHNVLYCRNCVMTRGSIIYEVMAIFFLNIIYIRYVV